MTVTDKTLQLPSKDLGFKSSHRVDFHRQTLLNTAQNAWKHKLYKQPGATWAPVSKLLLVLRVKTQKVYTLVVKICRKTNPRQANKKIKANVCYSHDRQKHSGRK